MIYWDFDWGLFVEGEVRVFCVGFAVNVGENFRGKGKF